MLNRIRRHFPAVIWSAAHAIQERIIYGWKDTAFAAGQVVPSRLSLWLMRLYDDIKQRSMWETIDEVNRQIAELG